jgi:hypothetical protein
MSPKFKKLILFRWEISIQRQVETTYYGESMHDRY